MLLHSARLSTARYQNKASLFKRGSLFLTAMNGRGNGDENWIFARVAGKPERRPSGGYDPLTRAIADFVRFTAVGSNTRVYVDGNGGGDNFSLLAVFMNGVTGTPQDLLNSGNLVLDQSVVV